ncbi:MAG: fibrillarin-like rRNA/tRNA 2'-O-methyltransferase, partial [Candidatus Thermoplasmatota archaeon]|nr:fibrillarin-like rRNA/tRNA 2'-O-methyltransferase [Candidatus Thermoplasmatota archaeon]
KQLFTENLQECKGIKVYGEKIIKDKNKELRSWIPYRSKLAAAILNGVEIEIKKDYNVLYLGAATGTTVSHISDITRDGIIYAVESSPISMKKLITVCEKRPNIIPILNDAFHPDRYASIVPSVDLIYQDISQRNQAEIFVENIKKYLKENGTGIIMVKARSIDVAMKPKIAYEKVCNYLKENSLNIKQVFELEPYEKDHAVIIISK